MGKQALILCLLTLLAGSTASCQSQQQEVERSIKARYEQFNQAWGAKDRDKVEDIFAPECEFKQADEAGSLKLPKFMKGIEFSFLAMNVLQAETQIESLVLSQDTAEVKAKIQSKTQLVNVGDAKVNQSAQIVHDTWKKTPAGWRIFRRVIGE